MTDAPVTTIRWQDGTHGADSMTDQPDNAPTEERFPYATEAAVPANQHIKIQFRDENTETLRIVEWITPDALPADHHLD